MGSINRDNLPLPPIPHIPEALILALEARFKPTPVAPGVDADKALFQNGKCDLIRFLKETHNLQQEEDNSELYRETLRHVHQQPKAPENPSTSADPCTTSTSRPGLEGNSSSADGQGETQATATGNQGTADGPVDP